MLAQPTGTVTLLFTDVEGSTRLLGRLGSKRYAEALEPAHGGQVLVSETTGALLDGAVLRDLGPHRLKDLLEPIRLHQLLARGLPDEFPPPRTLKRTNLPLAAWPLLGRERELEEIHDLIAGGARLVTLTGPGGSGKTRLALQAAAELSDEFPDGVFFVALAPLRETQSMHGAVAEAVGLQADDDVAACSARGGSCWCSTTSNTCGESR